MFKKARGNMAAKEVKRQYEILQNWFELSNLHVDNKNIFKFIGKIMSSRACVNCAEFVEG